MSIWDNIADRIKDLPISDVLRERLALAVDQSLILEKKASELGRKVFELNGKVANLESENQSLRLDLHKAKDKIRNLEEQLKEKIIVGIHNKPLEKEKVEILSHLSKQKGLVTADEVARHLRINSQIALHHLTELNKKIMVLVSHRANLPPFWSLADEGRKYLIDNKLTS